MGTYEWKPFTLLVSAEEVEKEVLKIEAGKYYKTRDGRKVGPMVKWRDTVDNPWEQKGGSCEFDSDGDLWADDGTSKYNCPDLISEWQDETPSPIRTVTRREPVQGNYGIVSITKNNKVMIAAGDHSSEELEEAAHLLHQLAEVKKENGK